MSTNVSGEVALLDDEIRIRRDVADEPGPSLVSTVRYHVGPDRLAHLEAVAPWPRIRVRTLDHDLTIRPGRGVDERVMGAQVERIFDWAARRSDATREPGWLTLPVVPWERAETWPTEQKRLGDGAFRTAPGALDPLVAERTGPTPLERFWIWLSTGEPSRDADVALTGRFVYRRRAGRIERVPRDTLRSLHRSEDDDRVFCFGRSTKLLLLARPDPCPLVAGLEADLEERDGR
ncbi:MAG TPA: hypothetical protein RMH99_32790 [Sandaracinaceae bacterium LLY-WYZ-13_1]|nr:hypothetical protein [Sandaracinaceae bacterium LLY-WYZ-13_1]